MRQCEVCKKGSLIKTSRQLLRGHYNPVNTQRKYPNLQKVRISDEGRVLVCMKCRKSILKGKVSV